MESLAKARETKVEDTNVFDLVIYIIGQGPTFIKLIYLLIQLKERGMSDFKTTVASVIQALVLVGGLIGVKIAPAQQEIVVTATVSVYAVVNMVKGFFTKDKEAAK